MEEKRITYPEAMEVVKSLVQDSEDRSAILVFSVNDDSLSFGVAHSSSSDLEMHMVVLACLMIFVKKLLQDLSGRSNRSMEELLLMIRELLKYRNVISVDDMFKPEATN